MIIRKQTYVNEYYDRLLRGMSKDKDLTSSKAILECIESHFKTLSKETINKYLTIS